LISNGQGCSHFISPKINFSNVRFDHCTFGQERTEQQTNIAGVTGTGVSGLATVSDNDSATIAVNNTEAPITGTAGNDILTGTAHVDFITGLGGNDTLTGGGGSDRFIYTASNQGVDTITDFSPANEVIQITASGSGFSGTGLVAGNALSSSQFRLGSSATNPSHRFIYNQTTGALFFDADGSGSGAAQQLATLTGNPTITNQSFWIA
jgi:Ca2+-binding RTX toxin-like protein